LVIRPEGLLVEPVVVQQVVLVVVQLAFPKKEQV
jgi:hypothetical protein